jgi:ORF6N domain
MIVPSNELTPAEIRNLIYHIRGKAVMIDSDLSAMYQVETGRLNEAVRRNIRRFPEDFMFRLTAEEADRLRSQIAISKNGRGGRRYLPYAFTEQGVTMLSCVLNSDIAIDVNINIMRAFVQIRRIGMSVIDLKRKIDSMERKYDHNFKVVFDALRQLIAPPPAKKTKTMGFTPPDKDR